MAVAGPVVTSVSPIWGPATGGFTVTLSGHGFTGAVAVKFGLVDATSFSVINDTTITCVSPSMENGICTVRVTTPNGTSPPTLVPFFDDARFTISDPDTIVWMVGTSGRALLRITDPTYATTPTLVWFDANFSADFPGNIAVDVDDNMWAFQSAGAGGNTTLRATYDQLSGSVTTRSFPIVTALANRTGYQPLAAESTVLTLGQGAGFSSANGFMQVRPDGTIARRDSLPTSTAQVFPSAHDRGVSDAPWFRGEGSHWLAIEHLGYPFPAYIVADTFCKYDASTGAVSEYPMTFQPFPFGGQYSSLGVILATIDYDDGFLSDAVAVGYWPPDNVTGSGFTTQKIMLQTFSNLVATFTIDSYTIGSNPPALAATLATDRSGHLWVAIDDQGPNPATSSHAKVYILNSFNHVINSFAFGTTVVGGVTWNNTGGIYGYDGTNVWAWQYYNVSGNTLIKVGYWDTFPTWHDVWVGIPVADRIPAWMFDPNTGVLVADTTGNMMAFQGGTAHFFGVGNHIDKVTGMAVSFASFSPTTVPYTGFAQMGDGVWTVLSETDNSTNDDLADIAEAAQIVAHTTPTIPTKNFALPLMSPAFPAGIIGDDSPTVETPTPNVLYSSSPFIVTGSDYALTKITPKGSAIRESFSAGGDAFYPVLGFGQLSADRPATYWLDGGHSTYRVFMIEQDGTHHTYTSTIPSPSSDQARQGCVGPDGQVWWVGYENVGGHDYTFFFSMDPSGTFTRYPNLPVFDDFHGAVIYSPPRNCAAGLGPVFDGVVSVWTMYSTYLSSAGGPALVMVGQRTDGTQIYELFSQLGPSSGQRWIVGPVIVNPADFSIWSSVWKFGPGPNPGVYAAAGAPHRGTSIEMVQISFGATDQTINAGAAAGGDGFVYFPIRTSTWPSNQLQIVRYTGGSWPPPVSGTNFGSGGGNLPTGNDAITDPLGDVWVQIYGNTDGHGNNEMQLWRMNALNSVHSPGLPELAWTAKEVSASWYWSWTKLAIADANLGGVAPPTRQFPRDDNLALGSVRQPGGGGGQPSSVQHSRRQGASGTYS